MTEFRSSQTPPRPFFYSVAFYFLLLFIPVIAAALARPFALWDDLTIPEKLQGGFAHKFANLPGAVAYYFTAVVYVFRPVILSFYNLFYLVFGGELWVLQGLKWCARGLYLLCTDRLLARYGYSPWTRLLVFTFLLFHPALQDVMLFSDDGWLALAISALLLYLSSRPPVFDLGAMSPRAYAGFLALVLAAMGMKEVAVVFGLVLALVCTLRTRGAARWRVAPVWLLVAYWAGHLAMMLRAGYRVNAPAKSLSAKFQVLLDHLEFVAVPSPLHASSFLLAGILIYGLVRIARDGTPDQRWMAAFAVAASAGMLAFTSNVLVAAIRYVIASVVLLALPLAAGTSRLPNPAKAAFVLLFPLLMAVHIYSQPLAFQQFMYETSEVITALERKSQQGHQIAMAPDVPGEFQGAIQLYFRTYRSRFYDGLGATEVTLGSQPLPAGPTAMLSMKPPSEWRAAPGYTARAKSVECFKRERYGVLQKLQIVAAAAARSLGFTRILYEHGGPVVSYECAFFIHTLGDPVAEREQTVAPEPLSYPLGNLYTLDTAMYWGALKVDSGKATLGIADSAGRVIWTADLNPRQGWQPAPIPPLGIVPAGDPLTLRLSASGRVTAKGFGAVPYLRWAPARRYGSVLR